MNKFLIIGGIAIAAWIAAFLLFTVSRWLGFGIHVPDWLGLILYITVEILAPVALVIAIIDSIACAIKSELKKRA